jgi:hypothetical protein
VPWTYIHMCVYRLGLLYTLTGRTNAQTTVEEIASALRYERTLDVGEVSTSSMRLMSCLWKVSFWPGGSGSLVLSLVLARHQRSLSRDSRHFAQHAGSLIRRQHVRKLTPKRKTISKGFQHPCGVRRAYKMKPESHAEVRRRRYPILTYCGC